jgi:hypothetical protein
MGAFGKIKNDLGFDRAPTRVHTRSRSTALLRLLGELGANAIEGGFDAGAFVQHDLKAALNSNIGGFDLNN